MEYSFRAYGHPNITGKHRTTFEFTKDSEVTLKGDCIVGVKADFSLKGIKEFIQNSIKNNNKKIKIIIKTDGKEEIVHAELNPSFNSDREMVVRKSGFLDGRTLAVKADKAASDLKTGIKPDSVVEIVIDTTL